jgi:Putative Ig domain
MESRKFRVFGLFCLSFLFSAILAHASGSISDAYYGPGLGSDGLANTVVGGPSGNVVSYRFRAGHSGSLQQIHVYLIQQHAGYSAGTGGQIQITVNTDDGTPSHNPSSTVLATYLLSNPASATPSIYFPIFVFPVPPTLVQGQLYHIVFTNVDPNSTANYLSVDALYYANPTTPAQPTISDVDSAELLSGPSVAWAPRKGYTPILELDYQDGFSELIGYMEVWVGVPQNISGTSAVRETFTVSKAQRTVTSASVRVARTSGAEPLTIRLENGDGSIIEEGQIPAASAPLTSPTSYTWVTYTFSSAHDLAVGQTYSLEFDAPSTSNYQAYPIRKGSAYGFQNTTYFPDGYAQFNSSGFWVGWTQWGVSNRTDGDLQFYFGLATSSTGPTISSVQAGSITFNSATISWTTDQASTSQVEYGTTTAYGNLTAVDSNDVTSHSVNLTGLVAATLYHYRVHSMNTSSSETISGDLTFTTSAPALAITTTSLPNATQNLSYSALLSATGGTPPYVWSIASGALPAGLTLAAGTGTISGTPTGSGTATFTVNVTDSASSSATKALSVTVNSSLVITTIALPSATLSVPYSATVSASGGTAPYAWTIASGALPSGLVLSSSTGSISGTPAASGTGSFTIQASDASSRVASKAFSIAIAAQTAIALKQSNAAQGWATHQVSVSFPSSNTAGNLILAFVRMSTTYETVTVTDSARNTYVEAAAQTQNSDSSQIHLFYAKNVKAGSNTVTATFSSTNTHPWLATFEYAGLNPSNPLDRKASSQGRSAIASSGITSSTSSPNELIFAGFGFSASYAGSQSPGVGFTLLRNDQGTSPAATESKLATATGSFGATFNLSSTVNWSGIIATFKP